jgi:hypothetical protein
MVRRRCPTASRGKPDVLDERRCDEMEVTFAEAAHPTTGQRAVLGRNALEGRATAFEPDAISLAQTAAKVNVDVDC